MSKDEGIDEIADYSDDEDDGEVFSQESLKEIESITKLQNLFFDDDIEATCETLKKSSFMKGDMYELADTIATFMTINVFADLSKYFSIIEKLGNKELNAKIADLCIKKQCHNNENTCFIARKLWKAEMTSFEDVQRKIFCFELKYFFPEKYDASDLEKKNPNQRPYIQLMYANNKSVWEEIIDHGTKVDSIEYDIMKDNISGLQERAANSEIEYDKLNFGYNSYESLVTRNISYTYISLAAHYASVNCFKFMILNGATISKNILDDAIKGGSLEIIKIIQDHDVINNNYYNTLVAAQYFRNDILDWLFDKYDESQLKKLASQCLPACGISGNMYAFQKCINLGAKIGYERRYRTIITSAAENGHISLLKIVLDYDDDIRNFDFVGENPLQAALQHKFAETADILLQKGASVSKWASNNRTPFFTAVESGDLECVKLIARQKGCRFNESTHNPFISPFLCAIKNCYVDIVEYLLTIDEIIKDGQGEYGKNAFHFLAESESPKAVKIAEMLIGILPKKLWKQKDKSLKLMPLDSALIKGNKPMIEFFKAHDFPMDTNKIQERFKSFCYDPTQQINDIIEYFPEETQKQLREIIEKKEWMRFNIS